MKYLKEWAIHNFKKPTFHGGEITSCNKFFNYITSKSLYFMMAHDFFCQMFKKYLKS